MNNRLSQDCSKVVLAQFIEQIQKERYTWMDGFGRTKEGEKASLYYLKNKNDMEIAVSDYGATLVKVLIPDKNGEIQDVVLGYDTSEEYERANEHFGATVGRVANRIGGASFVLHGKEYRLFANVDGNSLHGGKDFYGKRVWKVEREEPQKITFFLHSPDGDQGYPGNLDIRVTYELTDRNGIKITYHGTTDQDTPVNLTNHSYFNLSGHASGTVLEQKVMIDGDGYTRADAQSITTGEILPVEGTPMDFRSYKAIGAEIDEDVEALRLGRGYDHNWVLNGTGLRRVAGMVSEKTGIRMEVYTDLPGMQFYTANYLKQQPGKEGAVYRKRDGACFETQYFPDAIHKEHFAGPVLKAGEAYDTTTIYQFSVQ